MPDRHSTPARPCPHGARDELVPRLARLHGEPGAVAAEILLRTPRGAHADDRARGTPRRRRRRCCRPPGPGRARRRRRPRARRPTSSASARASASRPAGPPSRSVVRGPSGVADGARTSREGIRRPRRAPAAPGRGWRRRAGPTGKRSSARSSSPRSLGQALAGHERLQPPAARPRRRDDLTGRYVTSSSFGVDVMENWQSEYLQFTLYILATVWLVQRGSTESKQPGDEGVGVRRGADGGPPRAPGLAGVGQGGRLAHRRLLAPRSWR